jgi:hypothetical protein
MGRKKAIRLRSSNKVYGHDDGSFVEHTLVSLLEEGWKKKLKDNDRVIVTDEYLRDNFNSDDIPTENDLRLKKEIITYGELKRVYERTFDREYSPEEEKERSDFQLACLEKEGERRGAWGMYSQTMSYIRAIEEDREEKRLIENRDEKGLAKFKEKQNNRTRMLHIG